MFRVFLFACIFAGSLLCLTKAGAGQTSARPSPSAANGFRISGTVVDREGGQMLANARVTIRSTENGSAQRGDPAQTVATDTMTTDTVTTDEDGRFEFRGLKAGKYELLAERRGYVQQGFDQHEEFATAIVVGPRLQSEDLVFRMRPDAAISGTIVDEASEPIRGAQVMLIHDAVENGMRTTHLRTQNTSDDQGHYHFGHVIPGTYFIAVTAQPWYAAQRAWMKPRRLTRQAVGGGGGTEVDASNSQEEVQRSPLDVAYPTTYYPGTTEESAASPLVVKAGDRASADVMLTAVPALHLHIKGVSSDVNAGASASLTQHVFGMTLPSTAMSERVGTDLEVFGMAPGQFQLAVQSFAKPAARWWRSVELSADAEVTASQNSSPAAVSGVAEVDGVPAAAPAVVQLWDPASQQAINAQVGDKGEFQFGALDVLPGHFRVRVANLPGVAVRSVTAEGAKVVGQTLQIGNSGTVRLKIAASRHLARVDGVALRNGKPAAGVMVVLVPRNAAENAELFRRDQSDSDGTFSLRFAVPGSYTVVAIADGWDMEWLDPAILRPYLQQGQAVEVTPGGKHRVEVKVQ